MRCAVPSSKVGSCDSASAAAERDSGVDAAAGLIGAVCATGLAAPAGAAVTGLAGTGAGPEPAILVPSANAGAVASIVAMAMIVILRMGNAPGDAAEMALTWINNLGCCSQTDGIGPDPQFSFS